MYYNQRREQDELMHYGVLGMRWGHRKATRNEKTARKKDLKNRRTLSDKDLQQKINRLQSEKKFKELSEADLKPKRTAVKKFMKTVGGKVVTSAAVGGLAYAGKHYVSKRNNVNWEELANYMFSNPNKKK